MAMVFFLLLNLMFFLTWCGASVWLAPATYIHIWGRRCRTGRNIKLEHSTLYIFTIKRAVQHFMCSSRCYNDVKPEKNRILHTLWNILKLQKLLSLIREKSENKLDFSQEKYNWTHSLTKNDTSTSLLVD